MGNWQNVQTHQHLTRIYTVVWDRITHHVLELLVIVEYEHAPEESCAVLEEEEEKEEKEEEKKSVLRVFSCTGTCVI